MLIIAGAAGLPAHAPWAAGAPAELLIRFRGDTAPFRTVVVEHAATADSLSELARRADVMWAEPNGTVQLCDAPDDPGFPLQWNMENDVRGGIHVEEAWSQILALGKTPGAGALVAVVDTGLAYEDAPGFVRAADFVPERIRPGPDLVDRGHDPNDDVGHGTHVAGTIAAGTNDGVGFAGIAYGATLMPIKVVDKYGNGSFANVALGVRAAADAGAQVINLSLGSVTASHAMAEAVAYAFAHGSLVVAAAGNLATRKPFYPAAYDRCVLAVSATRYDNSIAWYSNRGPHVDLAAPGGDPNADQNGDGVKDDVYQLAFDRDPLKIGPIGISGTSMAAAHVSGVAALLDGLGVKGPERLRRILQSTAHDLGRRGWDDRYGWGLVDAGAAVKAAGAGR